MKYVLYLDMHVIPEALQERHRTACGAVFEIALEALLDPDVPETEVSLNLKTSQHEV